MHGNFEMTILLIQMSTVGVLIIPMIAVAIPQLGAFLEDKAHEKYIHIPITMDLQQKLFAALKLPQSLTSASVQATPLRTLNNLERQVRAHKGKKAKLSLEAVSTGIGSPVHKLPAVCFKELEGTGNKAQVATGGGMEVLNKQQQDRLNQAKVRPRSHSKIGPLGSRQAKT